MLSCSCATCYAVACPPAPSSCLVHAPPRLPAPHRAGHAPRASPVCSCPCSPSPCSCPCTVAPVHHRPAAAVVCFHYLLMLLLARRCSHSHPPASASAAHRRVLLAAPGRFAAAPWLMEKPYARHAPAAVAAAAVVADPCFGYARASPPTRGASTRSGRPVLNWG